MHYILYGMNHYGYCNIKNIVTLQNLGSTGKIHRNRLYWTFTRK